MKKLYIIPGLNEVKTGMILKQTQINDGDPIMSNTSRSLIGNQVLMCQFADFINCFIVDESWSDLRRELSKTMSYQDRKLMPGFRNAEIIHFPKSQKLVDTPTVIISILGLDDRLYEWEGTIVLDEKTRMFVTMGHLHMISEPEIDYTWAPSLPSES